MSGDADPETPSGGVLELRDALASGALAAIDLAETLLERISELEPEICAWAWIDPDEVRRQARAMDRWREAGHPLGPLHGLPVGVKDVIDVARIPCENGCRIDAGRVPETDAWVVRRLRAAGGYVMGKTVTTELAYMNAGRTRNPHDRERTPGGSSSGSAAAVAAGMVPLAIGTQTGGSVIRPAAFCGVTGFKPSYGAIPRTGVLMQSHTLDTLGVFAAEPEGAALLAEALFGWDEHDPATRPTSPPRLLAAARAAPAKPPVFAFARPPGWDDVAAPEMKEALLEFVFRLGDRCIEIELPPIFDEAAALRAQINFAEMAHYYRRYAEEGPERLGDVTRAAMADGAASLTRDYLAALDRRGPLSACISEILERCDAILCPAAAGPAPLGLEYTGNPIFNGLWTWLGTPAITLPLLATAEGLPMGVQLVGARGADGRLLSAANALWREFAA
mgnify:CR=1 FL=1